jgi:hypothetical protein
VRRAADNAVVFSGKLGSAEFDELTGDRVQAADFSALRQAGTYYLACSRRGAQLELYREQEPLFAYLLMAMRGFYGQRCGTAVDMGPEFPGYKHPACHLKGEFHPSSGLSGAARQRGRLARRGRLWALRGQLRYQRGHAALDLGDIR